MTELRIQALSIDSGDPDAIATFWAAALGARRVDVGQGSDSTWVVMADPDGNEFCVLRAYTPEELAEIAAEG